MKLEQYQWEAARTAEPAAYDRAYLIPMIVGETGELFGQRAKSVWHGWDAEKLELELVSEYGDVAWGTAILLDLENHSMSGQEAHQPRTIWGGHLDPWHMLLQRATNLSLYYSQPETYRFIGAEAERIWATLETFSERITGRTFDHVLDVNLKKLADRAARGVLKGAGDHR